MGTLNINWKSFVLTAVLIGLGLGWHTDVQAQRKRIRGFWDIPKQEEYSDSYLFYIGMTAPTYSYAHYFIEKNPNWNTLNVELPDGNFSQFSSINTTFGHELGLGIPLRVRINNNTSFITGVSALIYRGRNANNNNSKSAGVSLEYEFNHSTATMIGSEQGASKENFSKLFFPFHFKLASDYKHFSQNSPNPYRLYLVGGGNFNKILTKYSYNNMENFDKIDPPIILKPSYWDIEAGMGIDVYFPYFKMSLETSFSQSIGNILDHNRHQEIQNHFTANGKNKPNPYMDAISKLGIRGWQFRIIFE